MTDALGDVERERGELIRRRNRKRPRSSSLSDPPDSNDTSFQASQEDLEAANLVLSLFGGPSTSISTSTPAPPATVTAQGKTSDSIVAKEEPMDVDVDSHVVANGAAPRITLRMPKVGGVS